jgi:ubiquinone/menaquinone biosynthesis C-methylase UbiE
MDKLPGHWVLARMGKRVLRPGGLELTHRLLAELAISSNDDAVEFAPGLGVTARLALAQNPKSYTAVERDPNAVAIVQQYLTGRNQKCVLGTAEETGLPDQTATVVYGEAMLSMQPATTKLRIIREAARLLRLGGHYGIHELCLVPDEVDESVCDEVQRDLSDEIHVGVRLLTARQWRELLLAAGLTIVAEDFAPMKLLEPGRIIKDEGLLGAMCFAWNVATHAAARRRVLKMRRVFRKYNQNLAAIVIVARKSTASNV